MKKINVKEFIKSKYIKIIVVAAMIFLAALYISTYWYQVALIQGDSMQPTYHNGQFVLLDKHTDNFACGDVVAFRCEGVKGVLIKRIAAVPGDTVQISEGILYRNGVPVEEAWINGEITYAGIAEQPLTLSEGEYFMLGDNYEESKDSRYEKIGNISEKNILGKVIELSIR